jgi:hypothetical protein
MFLSRPCGLSQLPPNLIPCLSMAVMLFLRSSKHALSRFASSLDMPCCMSCFSKAFLALRTLRPRVRYIQSRLRVISTKCGKDFITVVNIETTLIDTQPPFLGKRRLFLFLTHFTVDALFDVFAYVVFSVWAPSAFSSTSKHVAETCESPHVLFSHFNGYWLR